MLLHKSGGFFLADDAVERVGVGLVFVSLEFHGVDGGVGWSEDARVTHGDAQPMLRFWTAPVTSATLPSSHTLGCHPKPPASAAT